MLDAPKAKVTWKLWVAGQIKGCRYAWWTHYYNSTTCCYLVVMTKGPSHLVNTPLQFQKSPEQCHNACWAANHNKNTMTLDEPTKVRSGCIEHDGTFVVSSTSTCLMQLQLWIDQAPWISCCDQQLNMHCCWLQQKCHHVYCTHWWVSSACFYLQVTARVASHLMHPALQFHKLFWDICWTHVFSCHRAWWTSAKDPQYIVSCWQQECHHTCTPAAKVPQCVLSSWPNHECHDDFDTRQHNFTWCCLK